MTRIKKIKSYLPAH